MPETPRQRASLPRAASHRVVLGRVRGAHALRGQLRVSILGDGPDNLARVPEVWLAADTDARQAARYEVVRCAPGRRGEVRLTLAGLDDRETAEGLKGLLVLADPSQLDPLPPGDHYWFELVGCEALDEQGVSLGRIRELGDNGAHDLLVIEREDAPELLVPAVEAWLARVDPENRQVVVRLLPGLLEPSEPGVQP